MVDELARSNSAPDGAHVDRAQVDGALPSTADLGDAAAAEAMPGRDALDAGPSSGRQNAPGKHRKQKARDTDGRNAKRRPFWIEAVVLIAVAVLIAFGVHTFLFQAYYIPSGSMENTLHIGDRVLVNKLSYKVGHVQRGQIVVFNGEDSWDPEVKITPPSNVFSRVADDIGGFFGAGPSDEKDYIKRVIGIPGDHVQCCDDQGRILVNGVALNENYLFSGPEGHVVKTTTQVNASTRFDIVVQSGRLWVEGDHRDDSRDSRAHLADPGGGTIPESRVIGRAFVIIWPVGHWRGLGIPASYHELSNAAAVGAPYVIGAATIVPIGLVRRRRRRRAATGSTRRASTPPARPT